VNPALRVAAGVVRGAETVDFYRTHVGEQDGPKPGFGVTAGMEGTEDAITARHTVPNRARLVEGLQARYGQEGGLPDVRVR
jgi:hypothetical protein